MGSNDFGKNILVEDCQKLKISDFMKVCRESMKKLILESEIQGLGLQIDLTTSKTNFGGTRFWFVCPVCRERVGVLLNHPVTHQLGCRKCLGLNYAKRRYKGMIEENI